MSGSTFGTLFCVTNFGESHGPAIGCVIDGCPPGLALCEADIQHELNRRRMMLMRHARYRPVLARRRHARAGGLRLLLRFRRRCVPA